MHLHFKSNHPFKSFEEQLSILEERGLAIDDYKLALDAMESFSYYTIVNGYKDLFLDPKYQNRGIERFKKGTTFSMLYQAHWIDLSMSSLLFKYTLAVEKKLKTQVSYLIGEKLSIEESLYLNKKFYGQNKANRGKLFQLKEKINEAKEKDISAKYYWEKEHNVPPWIAAKAISFGSIVTWYSLLTEYHKNCIIDGFKFNTKGLKQQERLRFFNNSINQVYDYRNLTAHGNRTFCLNLQTSQKILHLKTVGKDVLIKDKLGTHNNDLFSVVFTILSLLTDNYVATNMIVELKQFFSQYDSLNLAFLDKDIFGLFNFPRDFDERLETAFKQRFES